MPLTLKSRLSTSELRLMRSSPAVFLAYCGLRTALLALDRKFEIGAGLVIFVVPQGFRLDDYRMAADYFFLDDQPVSWTNPDRLTRVYQAPARTPTKGIAHEISVFDLPEAVFLVGRDRADVSDEVQLAASAIVDVKPPSPAHINATRRLLRLPQLILELAEDLSRRPQKVLLAGILRPDLAVSDLRRFEKASVNVKSGPALASIPGFAGPRAWADEVLRDVSCWRKGTLDWNEVPRGALLSGPPGTGKTMFAQAFAVECGFKLITASIGGWEEAGYLHHTLAAMRKSFDNAIDANGAVLFVDELDGLARRDRLKGEHVDYRQIVINQFLSLSSLPMEGVILLGATNYPDRIDPAALRAGRIEQSFAISLPDQQGRAEILAFHLGEGIEARILMDVVADLDGYSGADLELLVKKARRLARALDRGLELEDVRAVLPVRIKFTTEERFRLAVHEAGHALVALNLRQSRNVTITVHETYDPARRANIGGFAKHDAFDDALRTEKWLLNRIAVSLAGMAAEEVIHSDRSIGSGGGVGTDVEVATSIARCMVGSYGLGRFPTFIKSVEEVYQNPLPQTLEDEVHKMLAEQYRRVVAILKPERERVMALAKQATLNKSVTIGVGDEQ